MKNKSLLTLMVALAIIVLLAVLNLIWRFSSGVSFGDMNVFKQINIIASAVCVLSGVPSLVSLIIQRHRFSKKN